MDKTKFTRDPQLDSEGFVDTTSPCRGCSVGDHCPRSATCIEYDSPLRDQSITFMLTVAKQRHQDNKLVQALLADHKCVTCQPAGHITPMVPSAAFLPRPNPKGWDEVDGVKLPSVSPWAAIDDDELEARHRIWLAGDQ